MITKKSPEEIATLRIAGGILAKILKTLAKETVVGVSTLDLDDRAMQLTEEYGVEPVLLGYHPEFAPYPYPAAICISVNNCVQHGIPSENIVLKEGDVVNLDMTIAHNGMIVDSGITVGVGVVSDTDRKLMAATQEALAVALKAAKPGNHIGDISNAIETFITGRGFHCVEVLCGHGVGYKVHEEPLIPNTGRAGDGPLIEVGHVYAIEPIVNVGTKDVWFDDKGDGYSVYTKDGSNSAHFEHTVVITDNGAEILTK
ncbi:MAG: type I methionyl aminopeptidase [Patescibacteria group bacterium]